MTALQPIKSARIPSSAGSRVGLAVVVFAASLAFFALDLRDPPFVDEYAYISQSYYADLFLDGKTNDRAWLDPPGYDLVPLPKYLIGLALRAVGYGRPGPEAARLWYDDTSSVFGTPALLTAARTPSIVLGAVGCVAVFALGVLFRDARVGLVAALLLAINPLYRLHAHRAMSEAPCETFLYTALLIAAWCWGRAFGPRGAAKPWLSIGLIGAGIAAGLSVLAKFNGLLALMTLAVWVVLGWSLPGRSWTAKLAFALGACFAVVAAWFVFLGLNPFMTARPPAPLQPDAQALSEMSAWRRFRFLIDHRRTMSEGQQKAFPHNALTTLPERAKVVAVQGFGRFGPLGPARSDSTRRYDFSQDAGAFVWLPVCVAGLACSLVLGLRQYRAGDAPLAWATAAWALLSLAVVTVYLPMAWDRYQLPIQTPFSLLAALFLVVCADAMLRMVRPSRMEVSA
jgi:4-amino-4-deoxy-L-arabinose transferase-like glycosyltransferase